MPRSHWNYILAAVGLIALTIGVLGYRELQRAEIDPYPNAHYQPARQPSFPPGWPQIYDSKSSAYEPNCEKPGNKEDSDLCAQWSAVEAVNETNRLTRIALNVSALEFGGLLLSLIFTCWAAVAASQAANAAKDAVEISARTERPIIFLTRIEPVITEQSVHGISLHFENAGRLPATFHTISFWGRDEVLSSEDFFNDLTSENRGTVLRNGDTTAVSSRLWDSSTTFPFLADRPILIRGAFRHDSQLGVRKWTYFCFSGTTNGMMKWAESESMVWRKHGGPKLNYEYEEGEKQRPARR